MVGIGYLRSKLAIKRSRVCTRYKYYEMKSLARDFGISTPPQLAWVGNSLGWCGKAVDALADRLQFIGFRDDVFKLGELFQLNNKDILCDSAILSALISSCSFIYIYEGSDGYPRMEVIDGGNATGEIDPTTGLLTEGYAVLDRDSQTGAPILEAYFEPGQVTYYPKDEEAYVVASNCPYVTLVPVVHRPDDVRPFGHSRISRACMSIQDSAIRTIKRSEIAAEFYSYPQKYVTGIAQDSEMMDKWKASMSAMMMFEKDDEGDSPNIGQFQAASQAPHLEQLRMFASLFGGETGLTLDDLGFATGNPSSAEAIKSAHETLRIEARKAQRCFGTGFLNAAMVAACVRDDVAYERKVFFRAVPTWEPVFELDGSAMSGIGDAVLKLEQALPGYLTEERVKELFGV